MKRFVFRLAGLLVAGLVIPTLPSPTPASAEVHRIVLRVNEQIATSHDYQRRRDERVEALRRAEGLSMEERQELLADIGGSIMSNLLEELLILSRAEQLGIRANEDQVSLAVQQAKDNLGIQTDEQFEEALASSGITAEELRAQMRRNLLMQEIMSREVHPRIIQSEEDLRRYYQSHSDEFQVVERLKLEEVVVLETFGTGPIQMSALAAEIRQAAIDGDDFSESVDPFTKAGTASGVIELGWVEPGDLDRNLEEAVWGLAVGDFSQPVPGRGGLHILHLAEREEARLLSFNEVQDQIARKEQDRKYQEEVRKYMAELQAGSYIVAHPPPEAASFTAELVRTRDEEIPGFSNAAAAMVDAGTEPGPGAVTGDAEEELVPDVEEEPSDGSSEGPDGPPSAS
jgi:peptidyl-prolyl cis-trans isomerase SurA